MKLNRFLGYRVKMLKSIPHQWRFLLLSVGLNGLFFSLIPIAEHVGKFFEVILVLMLWPFMVVQYLAFFLPAMRSGDEWFIYIAGAIASVLFWWAVFQWTPRLFKPITREDLVKTYGEEAVRRYEEKSEGDRQKK
jgi:hypothetical protein